MPTLRKTIETLARGLKTDPGAGVMPAAMGVPGTSPVMGAITALSERVEVLSMQIPQRIDRGLEVEAQDPPTANVIVQRGLAYAQGEKLESNVVHILPIPLSTITEPTVWYVMLTPGPEVFLSEAPIIGGAILAKIVAPSEDAQRVVDNAEDYEGADPDAYIVSGRDLVLTTGCVFDDETMEELLKALERVDMSALKGELVVDDTAAIKTGTESVAIDAEGITTFHRNGEMAAQLNNDGVAIWTSEGELVVSARGSDGQLNSRFMTNIDVPAGFCGWFDGTWAEAEALDGWAIRDGRSGTTDVVSGQRGIRSVAADQDSGDRGGSDTHIHSGSVTIDSGGSHAHTGSAAASSDQFCVQECAAGVCVSNVCHFHSVTINAGGAHAHSGSVSVDSASSWSPYQELIPIMKLVDVGQGTVTNADHGELLGLGDDDHSLYHTDARGDARYYLESEVDTWRAGVTVTEMGYLHGITSDLQTQMDTKMPYAGGTFTGDVTMQNAEQLRLRDTDTFISSPAAGKIRFTFKDDDLGAEFCSGVNLLLTIARRDGPKPTWVRLTSPDGMEIKAQGYLQFRFTSSYILTARPLLLGNHIKYYDNIKATFGSGTAITTTSSFDASIYYDATNLIIDPAVISSGKAYIGPTANKDIWFGNARVSGTGKIEFGGAESYIQEAAGPVMSYVTDGRHEFTGGPVYVGSGSPGHAITGSGDLYVADRFEADGSAYFDGLVYCAEGAGDYLYFGAGHGGGFGYKADDGMHMIAGYGGGEGYGNRNVILLDYEARADDYNHSAISANPTFIVHSLTRAGTATNQWWSITHDQTDALYSVGTGIHKFVGGMSIGAAATDYSEFETDGTLKFNGAATVWDDLRIVPGTFSFPGVADPTLQDWQPAGSGRTYKVWKFNQDDYVIVSCQIPHGWKEGSDIYVHVHWTPCDRGNEENGNTVAWKVDASWASVGGTYPASTTYDMTDTCLGTDDEHHMTPEVALSGSGHTISSILVVALYRDSGDTWNGVGAQAPALLEMDFHFELDTVGSRLIGSK